LMLVGVVECSMLCSGAKSKSATAMRTPITRQVKAATQ